MSKTIEDLVKERIDDMDIEGAVREYIKELAAKQVGDAIRSAMLTKIDGIIAAAIEVEMKRPVIVSDGWDRSKKYDTFEEFFRASFAKKLDGAWEIQKVIQAKTNERINELMKNHADAAIKKVVDELTRK